MLGDILIHFSWYLYYYSAIRYVASQESGHFLYRSIMDKLMMHSAKKLYQSSSCYCLMTTLLILFVSRTSVCDAFLQPITIYQSSFRRTHLSSSSSSSAMNRLILLHSTTNNNNEHSPPVITATGITLKLAVDANGAAADISKSSKSERFTSPPSLDMVHRLRCQSDVVLIGRTTVVVDNPSLTIRRVQCAKDEQPLRVILDPELKLIVRKKDDDDDDDTNHHTSTISSNYTVFTDGLPTVLYHCMKNVPDNRLLLDDLPESVTCVYIEPLASSDEDGGGGAGGTIMDVKSVVANLQSQFSVHHIMVEGGPFTAQSFLKEQLIDRALIVKAPLCFRTPLYANVGAERLQEAGLEYLGTVTSGDDRIECWSRPGLGWPTAKLEDWP